MTPLPSMRRITEYTGDPPFMWAGQCHVLSHKILDGELVEGQIRRGYWTGDVDPACVIYAFIEEKDLNDEVEHSWIQLADGRVMDCTRWVFEGAKPYIYAGPPDFYVGS